MANQPTATLVMLACDCLLLQQQCIITKQKFRNVILVLVENCCFWSFVSRTENVFIFRETADLLIAWIHCDHNWLVNNQNKSTLNNHALMSLQRPNEIHNVQKTLRKRTFDGDQEQIERTIILCGLQISNAHRCVIDLQRIKIINIERIKLYSINSKTKIKQYAYDELKYKILKIHSDTKFMVFGFWSSTFEISTKWLLSVVGCRLSVDD